MLLKNSIGIETPYGYRTCELYEGDLTSPEAATDLLVASAFAGSYDPAPGTLFAALKRTLDLDVGALPREMDLRAPFSIWISGPIARAPFRRLLCVELAGSGLDLGQALANVFVGVGILEAKGLGPRTLSLPLLGSGNQGFPPAAVVAELVPAAEQALRRFPSLERILFVDRDPAKVTEIGEALNLYLGRSRVHVPKGELMVNLRAELRADLDAAAPLVPRMSLPLLREMRRVLHDDRARSFEVGMLARRLVELIVDDLVQGRRAPELITKIERTAEVGLAPWIRSYMHLLRLIGNESAHEKPSEARRPLYVGEDDLVICLFCMQRLLRFWMSIKKPERAEE